MASPPAPAFFGPESPPAWACVQCGVCASGCPQARPPELSPRRVLRLLQLGLRQDAARHPFLQTCRWCGHCLVNCPQGVEVARILRRLAFERLFLDPEPPAQGDDLP